MSGLPGDSSPAPFVFPPFVPPVPRTVPAAPAPASVADDFAMEVPLPAHDLGDPDTDLPQRRFDADEAATQPWEAAAPPAADDLPWLEMPAEGPRVHATDDPPAADAATSWTPWDADAQPESAAAEQPIADFEYDYAPSDAGTSAAEPMPWVEEPAPAAEPQPAPWDAMFSDAAPETAPSTGFVETAPDEPQTVTAFDADERATDATAFSAFDAHPAPAEEEVEPAPAAAYAEFDSAPAAPSFDPDPTSGYDASDSEPALVADLNAAEPDPTPAYEPDSELPTFALPQSAPAVPADRGYGEVADRLETIARSLRDDPAAFLAGGSGDALGLLVTGFVLGYGHGRRDTGY